MCRPAQRPVEISQWDLVLQLTRTRNARDVIHLDPGVPDVTQILKGFGMKGAGNSHRPLTGINLEALELALEQLAYQGDPIDPQL